jgi:hypothetical protein
VCATELLGTDVYATAASGALSSPGMIRNHVRLNSLVRGEADIL